MALKNTTEEKLTRGLQKQLTAYSVAAGAALALAGAADAAIIEYSGPALPVDLNTPQEINIDGSGPIDFTFSVSANFSTYFVAPNYANPIGKVQAWGATGTYGPNEVLQKGQFTYTYWARNLPGGYQIGAANPNWSSGGNLQGQATWMGFSIFGGSFNGSTGYIGVKFYKELDPNPYFGWIEYQGDADSLSGTILGWAYEDTPMAPINAGQVPLPGTFGLGLLSLGAAGVARLRQRKKEAQKETA